MAARLSEETVTKTGSGDKRALILDAALNLFRHYGYRRTSMEDIARAANVAKGTLYIYFKSKDELFEALARQLARNVEASLNAVIDRELEPEEKISALLEAKLGFAYCWVLSSPHAAEILESSARIKEGVFEPVDRLFRSAVAQAIREGTRRGLFDPQGGGTHPGRRGRYADRRRLWRRKGGRKREPVSRPARPHRPPGPPGPAEAGLTRSVNL